MEKPSCSPRESRAQRDGKMWVEKDNGTGLRLDFATRRAGAQSGSGFPPPLSRSSTLRRSSATRTLVGVLSVLALVVASPAFARPARSSGTPEAQRAEQLYLEGAALYRAGKYSSAVEKLKAAYRAFPAPNLLYNIGRCYEALGRPKEAIDHYRRCVVDNRADAGTRAKARQRADVLQKIVRNARKAAPDAVGGMGAAGGVGVVQAPPSGGRFGPAGSVGTKLPRQSPGPADALPTQSGGTSSGALRVFKWLSGVVGLGLLGGGTAAFMLGKQDHDRIREAIRSAKGGVISMTLADARTLSDEGDTKKLIGYALWGAGGAALVVSAILFIVDGGASEAATSPRHALVPALLPFAGGAGVGLLTTF